ncbi:MAG: hypothetical protein LM567_04840 [Desulfurococcaceae archaeon]|nr:hypothetical protein [Desulfurococcaceae archaeon]
MLKNNIKTRKNVRVLVITNSGVYFEDESSGVIEIYNCNRISCSKCLLKHVCGYLS